MEGAKETDAAAWPDGIRETKGPLTRCGLGKCGRGQGQGQDQGGRECRRVDKYDALRLRRESST